MPRHLRVDTAPSAAKPARAQGRGLHEFLHTTLTCQMGETREHRVCAKAVLRRAGNSLMGGRMSPPGGSRSFQVPCRVCPVQRCTGNFVLYKELRLLSLAMHLLSNYGNSRKSQASIKQTDQQGRLWDSSGKIARVNLRLSSDDPLRPPLLTLQRHDLCRALRR